MAIDPTTNIGKVRLKVGDVSDLPFLPDSVYNQSLSDNNNDIVAASIECGTYILALMSQKTHKKMDQLEIYGNEMFKQYKEYLILLLKNPYLNAKYPIPYMPNMDSESLNPIVQFNHDWKEDEIVYYIK